MPVSKIGRTRLLSMLIALPPLGSFRGESADADNRCTACIDDHAHWLLKVTRMGIGIATGM